MGQKNDLTEQEKKKVAEMRDYLKSEFKTDSIKQVALEDLKKCINGEHMINRLQYRKAVGNMLTGKKQVVKKGEIFRQEGSLASRLEESKRHPEFGFHCLHYSVSESSGFINVKIHNKLKKSGTIGVRTVELPDGAKATKDFDPINSVIDLRCQEFLDLKIIIHDDDQWDPDKEFHVELFDPETGTRLSHVDT